MCVILPGAQCVVNESAIEVRSRSPASSTTAASSFEAGATKKYYHYHLLPSGTSTTRSGTVEAPAATGQEHQEEYY